MVLELESWLEVVIVVWLEGLVGREGCVDLVVELERRDLAFVVGLFEARDGLVGSA